MSRNKGKKNKRVHAQRHRGPKRERRSLIKIEKRPTASRSAPHPINVGRK